MRLLSVSPKVKFTVNSTHLFICKIKGGHTLSEWADFRATDIAKVRVKPHLVVCREVHGTVALPCCMKLRLLHDSSTETTSPQSPSDNNCMEKFYLKHNNYCMDHLTGFNEHCRTISSHWHESSMTYDLLSASLLHSCQYDGAGEIINPITDR